jgi:hypothetical protein
MTANGKSQASVVRELADGWRLEFHENRETGYRAYYLVAPDDSRERFTSATGVLDGVMPKDGLKYWAQKIAARDTLILARAGELDDVPADLETAQRLQAHGLGIDAERGKAADRGLSVHALLETLARDGTPPNPADHPPEYHGSIRAATRWWLHANPDPVAIEEIVCHREHRYAGRLDFRARIGGRLLTVDFKTQERGRIYDSAHVQAMLYELAARDCGDEPADGTLVVALGADGGFSEMDGLATEDTALAALALWRAMKPIRSAISARDRAEKKARTAAAKVAA